jgi:4,5-DOPA dioxygenase extradiol
MGLPILRLARKDLPSPPPTPAVFRSALRSSVLLSSLLSRAMSATKTRQPAVYIPHGGGPTPVLSGNGHGDMIQWLKAFQTDFLSAKPDAIVLVTAHWEESIVSITSAAQPTMLYDYGGFPPEAYKLQYPAPGHPDLAGKIQRILGNHTIPSTLNSARGYDHGVFVPLMLMFPEAEIPVVQMSILRSLDANEHIQLGEALRSLRDENILIVGSGLSFHSFKYLFGDVAKGHRVSEKFHEYLVEALVKTTDPAQRREKLKDWANAPFARECHPREEHLLPLMVVAGAGLDEPCDEIFDGKVMGIRAGGYLFGGTVSKP